MLKISIPIKDGISFRCKMPKYYVKSGQIKYIIDRNNHKDAILATLKFYKGKGLISGPKICVSEIGFEDFHKWICYDTDEYLKNKSL